MWYYSYRLRQICVWYGPKVGICQAQFCIRWMNQVKLTMAVPWWQCHKHCRGYYCYCASRSYYRDFVEKLWEKGDHTLVLGARVCLHNWKSQPTSCGPTATNKFYAELLQRSRRQDHFTQLCTTLFVFCLYFIVLALLKLLHGDVLLFEKAV